MKRIYLQQICQHGDICYIGKIDPRDLVRVATKVEMGEIQTAQRPLNKKRVSDIAKYVSEPSGILPNTLTLATKDNSFRIKELPDNSHFFYIDFPSTEDEFAHFSEKIDVMDGQHRLYSFLEEMRLIHDDDMYEIGFTLYDTPSLKQKQKIFISCNEKQEKVSGNLLMWFRRQLNMLSEEEFNFYNVVEQLSESYPLKGHIIMSAEKITNGVKAKEVMAALKQAKIHNLLIKGNPLTDEEKVKTINIYLKAWENFADFNFATSKPKDAGPAVKMAGLKFMLLLLPTIWDKAVAQQQHFTENFVKGILNQLATNLGVERDQFFTCDEHKFKFRDRTVTDDFANKCNSLILSLGASDFNPLG